MLNNKRLHEIDWSSYKHAHGNADDIPENLKNLFSNDQEKVHTAIQNLDDSLCHQHVGVSSALLPTFPFLIEALYEMTVVKNLGLLLELFWGISLVTRPPDRFYSIRVLDLSWTSIPNKSSEPTESYVQEIRHQLLINRAIFTPFLNHQEGYIFELARIIVANFTETPIETAHKLQTALLHETNPTRRNSLFLGFRTLQYKNKLDYLIQAFHEESNDVIKSTIAGQIAYEMKNDSPSEVVELLSKQILGTPETDAREAYNVDFFEFKGIPLALAQPDKYAEILRRYIEYMRHSPFDNESIGFLAFALCWNGKPDFEKLGPLQLSAIETVYQKSWQGKYSYPTAHDFRYFSLPTRQDEMTRILHEHK